ncbi:MAG: hypothetical protein V4857_03575 [Pseudomonadota bacterium]
MRKLLLVLVLMSQQTVSAAEAAPSDVARGFYAWRVASSTSGAPEPAELAEMRGFITPELACMLDASRHFRDAGAKAFPGDKPPYVEGDFYSSAFEGPTRFAVKQTRSLGARAQVLMHFFLDDEAGGKDRKGWHDRVHLQLIDGKWAISDIEYRAGFEFGNAGRLLPGLYRVMARDDKAMGWRASEAKVCRPRVKHAPKIVSVKTQK